MQGRLLAFFLPVFLLTVAVFGTVLAMESARSISFEGAIERQQSFQSLVAAVTEAVEASGGVEQGLVEQVLVAHRSDDDEVVVSVDGRRIPADPPARDTTGETGLAPGTTVWPWTDGHFMSMARFAVDTMDGSEREVVDVEVVAIDPADTLREATARRLLLIAAGVATAVAAIAAGTYPLTRLAMRPIRQLDDTANALANGNMSARATVGRGAPELRRLASTFNTMAERVNAGLARERAFVSSASHHFGNLLTPLRLRMETIERDDPAVDEALAELERLESAAERLLQLNRAEEDDLQPTAVDVGSIVDRSMQSWKVVTEANAIGLRRQGSETASALAVPGAVEETLDNLIDNAVKYGDGSAITLTVLRGLHNVRVMVSDRGPGMTEPEIELAQGRFWRGPSQQSKPGSGLGLGIVDALATRSGGHFELRSGADGGLEATLVLKRVTETEPGS